MKSAKIWNYKRAPLKISQLVKFNLKKLRKKKIVPAAFNMVWTLKKKIWMKIFIHFLIKNNI